MDERVADGGVREARHRPQLAAERQRAGVGEHDVEPAAQALVRQALALPRAPGHRRAGDGRRHALGIGLEAVAVAAGEIEGEVPGGPAAEQILGAQSDDGVRALLQVRAADVDVDHGRHFRLVGLLAAVVKADRCAVGRQRQVAQPLGEAPGLRAGARKSFGRSKTLGDRPGRRGRQPRIAGLRGGSLAENRQAQEDRNDGAHHAAGSPAMVAKLRRPRASAHGVTVSVAYIPALKWPSSLQKRRYLPAVSSASQLLVSPCSMSPNS